MSERICTQADCDEEWVARGLCKSHYNKARAAGALPQRSVDLSAHSISNVHADEGVGDCSVCGPGTRIRVRQRRSYPEYACFSKARESPERRRLSRMKLRYGVTEEEYRAAFAAQSGACGICGDAVALVVDHCHESGQVRGLLCRSCNVAIGFLRDSPDRARSAAEYLEAFQRGA